MLIEYHRNLLSDKTRNDAFHRALESVIEPGTTIVADVGSGTGLLGFLASRLGAKHVYLYEFGGVIDLSQKLAKANKIKNVTFMHGHSADMPDPPQVDVIVSETLGNYALEEHIISTIEDAKRFLKPGGTIIPARIEQFVCPVVSDRFHRELTVWDDVGFDLDLDAAKTMSLNNAYVRSFTAADLLGGGAAAQRWDEVDFARENHSLREGAASWDLEAGQTVYGFAVWWSCQLVPGIALGTSPLGPPTHWEQLYFPLLEPVEAKAGDTLSVTLSSTTSHEEGTILRWTATVKDSGGKTRKQALDLTKGYI